MEKVVVDLGNCIKNLKERHGYEKVILGGWSGGGSLSLFFQAQAENPTVTSTPAGDPPDLSQQGFVPADGIMLIAAHLARHRTFTQWLDPSVVDEDNPENRMQELDIYDPANPNQPPYSADFLERFAEAQIERNRRITASVKDKLAEYKANGEINREYAFVVHRTMADPRWLDPAVDPNEREPNWCFLGDPKIVNDSPIGLARYCSLRSWLSQWSFDDANGDGLESAKRITVPALVIGNTADDGITPSHTNQLYEAIGHDNKEIHWIEGANHYYFGQPDKAAESAALCGDWLGRQGLVE
jgi:pimeloyl-ACP methyl ester carboxylesterase